MVSPLHSNYSRNGHYEAAVLHSFVKDELSLSLTREISAHIQDCEDCQASCAFVRDGFKLLLDDGVPDLDPMAWRRIEVQLDRKRKAQTDAHLIGGFGWSSWWTRPSIWLTAGSLTLAALFGVWTLKRPSVPAIELVTKSIPVTLKTPLETKARAKGHDLILDSGRKLIVRGTPGTKLVQKQGEIPVFRLEKGELQVTEVIGANDIRKPLGLRAPGFRATARSSEFAVRYWARSVELEVGQGSVNVETPKSEFQTVESGQMAKIDLASVDKTQKSSSSSQERKGKGANRASQRAADFKDPMTDTEVDVIPPERSPLDTLWILASQAYYGRGETTDALVAAKKILATGSPDDRQYLQALNLLCEASISLEDGKSACYYCEKALSFERVSESRRSLHRRLGLVYREMMGDCQKAIEHFSKALVFGDTSLLDEQTVLGRAQCAYALGDYALAESDLNLLAQRGQNLIRKNEVSDLSQLLKTSQNKKAKN